jgi:hypothetical protein
METLPRNDLTGRRFGRFVVLAFYGRDHKYNALWACKCDCGQLVPVVGYTLTSGASTNCGCKRKETVSALRLKHGHSLRNDKVSPEYRAFHNAKIRCTRRKGKNWDNYGGRGIKFIFTSFEQFFAELGPRPTPAHTVDRKDNNGNYEPGNVRWATKSEQAYNRRPKKKN